MITHYPPIKFIVFTLCSILWKESHLNKVRKLFNEGQLKDNFEYVCFGMLISIYFNGIIIYYISGGKKWCVIDITFSQRRACSVGEPQENRGNRYKVEESFMILSAILATQIADELMNRDFMKGRSDAPWKV